MNDNVPFAELFAAARAHLTERAKYIHRPPTTSRDGRLWKELRAESSAVELQIAQVHKLLESRGELV